MPEEPESGPNRGETVFMIPPEGLIIGQDQDGMPRFPSFLLNF